jgi:hypothetical protein
VTYQPTQPPDYPRTSAVRRALQQIRNRACSADLLFLEDWEAKPRPEIGIALRVNQIRRANPVLAAEIRAEIKRGRPLTDTERAALVA